jgi:hypothetical protein
MNKSATKFIQNNLYRSSYYWNFSTSSFKQVTRLILEHVVKVKTLNGSEHDGRLFFHFFFIKIENFRGEGKMLMRHTHDTTFSENILDFYKILEESEQFFILFLKTMENLRRFFHRYSRTGPCLVTLLPHYYNKMFYWLIDWCLTSSEQFFSYIQDENI